MPSPHVSHLKFLSTVPSLVSLNPPTLGLWLPSSNVSGYSIFATLSPLISSGERMPNWMVLTLLRGALECENMCRAMVTVCASLRCTR